MSSDLNRVGLYLGLAWALALAALALVRLARASIWARAVFAAGAAYLLLVAAWFASSFDPGQLSDGTLERRLWLGQAVALVVLAAGIAWSWVRSRRARSAVAQLVVDLAQSPPTGGLTDVLAASVGDPDLVLAYPLDTTGRLVDADGQPVELDDRQEQTRLVRDGQVVAVLMHAPGLLDDDQLVDEVTAAARLALENERLQAEVRARLEELRASRARIVEAGDAERKRLERDLHDGAQQQLVSLSLSLRLARSHLAAGGEPDAVACLDAADAELREAIAELRELAHGIFPAVLADEGLAAAIEALAEEGRVPMQIRGLAEGRFAPQVETAAYTVVAEAVRATTEGVVVESTRSGDALLVDVETRDDAAVDLVALQDRLGALDGSLVVERRAGRLGHTPRRAAVRVVIADDETLLREGLARLLDEAGFQVVGKAASAEELMRRIELTRPDVAVVDIKMPPTHTDEGLVAAAEIRGSHPEVGVLVLSHYVESRYAMRLLEEHSERSGYLLKERISDVAVLVDALRRIDEGECVLDPTIVSRLVGRPREDSPLGELTARESEILSLMAEGHSNEGICKKLFLSPKTVETHVRHILGKLGIGETSDYHRRVLAVLAYLRR